MSSVATWWSTEAPARRAYVVGAALALVTFGVVLGPSFALGTSAYWDMPMQDHRAYMMGYRYFLDEPWHWPLFVTHTMNVPFDKSIAFTDSIPIWAFLHKAIGTVIPPWNGFTERAFIGLWYVLVFVLQACFGVAILRELGQRTWGAAVTATVMFLAVPAWLFRFNHASLDAHWLLLWALLLYLRTPVDAPAPRALRRWQVGHLALCSLINPYHAVVSLGIFLASLLRSRQWRAAAGWALAGVAAMLFALWLAGYFQHDARIKLPGFDVASANLLTFVLPRFSGIFGESLWTDGTGQQFEGLAYLGAGVLVLLVLFLPSLPSLGAAVKRHRYLAALAGILFVFSLSNHIYAGTHQLVAFPVPSWLRWVTYQFRSPGRFIWVPMYLIVIVLVRWALVRFRSGWLRAVLPAILLLQVVDAAGHARVTRTNTREAMEGHLDLTAWRALIARHSFVYAMPTNDCIVGADGVELAASEIQYLASERALPINGVYSARPTRDCLEEPGLWPSVPAVGGLYVLVAAGAAMSHQLARFGAACAAVRFGRVCSLDRGAITALIESGAATPIAPPPELAVGAELALGGETNSRFLEGDWTWPDVGGRFTVGAKAMVVFSLAGEPPEHPVLAVHAQTVICGARKENDLDVLVGTVPIGTLHFDASSNDAAVERTLPIPDRSLLRGPVMIELRARDTRPLDKVRCNQDPRPLGVFIKSLTIR